MRIKIYQPLAIHELGKRANQEDSIYPIEGKATENDRLFLLCDGMGGHEHGEVASQSICKSLSSFLLQHAVASEGLEDKLLSDALAYAYEELDKLTIAGDSRQMGTTLTLLYFHSNGCTAAHIGDSRIYHLRPSSHTILYKSRDHSLVYDLYQAGELTYEEMFTQLEIAIHQFAKRQMTWFRGMERRGTMIHWIDGMKPMEEKIAEIVKNIGGKGS